MENFENVSRHQVTPKDFFFNLSWLITLYGSVISLLNLLFRTIDQVFPDPVAGYYSYGYTAGIRWSIAWLIVLFPIYLILTRYIRKSFQSEPWKKDFWIRRWIVYLTLFLSSAAIIVDVIVLINNFLGGELTTRFLLKVLSTLVVALAVFGYYFYDLRNIQDNNRAGRFFAIGAMIFVLASLVWSFAVIGSPMKERLRRFDEQRVQGLQDIQYRIASYWQNKGELPKELDDLAADQISGYVLPVDPETKAQYSYRILNDGKGATDPTSELCATFNLSSSESITTRLPSDESCNHPAGNQCFNRNLDKDLYPIIQDGQRPIPPIKGFY